MGTKKGYGTMAVANCQGTQVINIGIGLAVPWLISSSTGVITELEDSLLTPCWIMVVLLLVVMGIEFSDVILYGTKRVYLTRTKAYVMTGAYFVAVFVYAICLVQSGEL